MQKWQVIVEPQLSGQRIMAADLNCFHELETRPGQSVLRLYSWRPQCISLGYSQRIEDEIDLDKAGKLGWDVIKRPTGGGIVFHNSVEVTYSIITAIDNPVLPKGLVPSYKKISEAVVLGLALVGVRSEIRPQTADHRPLNTGLCFSYPAEYEIVAGGKKIVGSAQKRGKRALLQQGSIFVADTSREIFSVLKKPHEAENAISVASILKRDISFEELSTALAQGFVEGLGIKLEE
ncbi:MAG: lipoate--protein ligase family protein [Candidatus Margulisbacteria bacterium]|nr:lipoate--protein ligase family protein [Candidatus Margulisiibacteriota bacterium]